MEKEIEVERDFVVTYNCHTDEYTVKGSSAGTKLVKGWEEYADNTRRRFARRMIDEDKSKGKVTWALTKGSGQRRSGDEFFDKIRWTFKTPADKSTGVYIFVNDRGGVFWTLTVPEKDLKLQLSPRVINKVLWEEGIDDFSGVGKLLSGSIMKP